MNSDREYLWKVLMQPQIKNKEKETQKKISQKRNPVFVVETINLKYLSYLKEFIKLSVPLITFAGHEQELENWVRPIHCDQ